MGRFEAFFAVEYSCPRCLWEGYEHDLDRKMEYAGSTTEPAEFLSCCPHCGLSIDELTETELE